MIKYKLKQFLLIDNITGKEDNTQIGVYRSRVFCSDDIIDFINNGYECATITKDTIRLSKVVKIGASSITKYLLFKEK